MDFIAAQSQSDTLNGAGSVGSLSEGDDFQRSPVKQAEHELKDMQQQIESYNVMSQQLVSQHKMAIKKLSDMDQQIKDLNGLLEQERAFVESKTKEIKERKEKLQVLKNDKKFDPFTKDDPFDRDDPFEALVSKAPLPEDDPFNPSSTSTAPSKFISPSNDPFAANLNFGNLF